MSGAGGIRSKLKSVVKLVYRQKNPGRMEKMSSEFFIFATLFTKKTKGHSSGK